ncbi:MAG: FtsX-like permease family protein, partial [Silvibacterium sp.]
AIASVDPALPVFNVSSWQDALGFFMLPERAATVALGVLGALAMMLAVTGIFGMASYTVSRRMRELGIRVALGAQSGQVLRAALGRTLLLLGIGSAAGLALGFAASHVLASIVYQASASDPLVIFAVVLTMALVGLLSAAWPARRALSAEPAMLLRDE